MGVLDDDTAGAVVLRQAERDGIDTSAVVRRGRTALPVGVVDGPGSRRLFEDAPEESPLTAPR